MRETVIVDSLAIQKRLAGDWGFFRRLVENYQGRAVGHALAIVGNREDALDEGQGAFLDAFRALGRFDRGAPVLSLAQCDSQKPLLQAARRPQEA